GNNSVDETSEPASSGPNTIAVLLQLLGIATLLLALIQYHEYAQTPKERHRFDMRALAEGLRVQFYWIIAGLHDSVAASYLQRQRGEMDWFRRVLSSLSAPYDRWLAWFRSLDDHGRRDALLIVTQCFVRGQMEQHATSYRTDQHVKRFRHEKAYSLIIAGFMMTLGEWCLSAYAVEWQPGLETLKNAAFVGGTLLIFPLGLCAVAYSRITDIKNGRLKFSVHQHTAENQEHLDLLPDHHVCHDPWLPEKNRTGAKFKDLRLRFDAACQWIWTFPVSWIGYRQVRYILVSSWLITMAVCVATIISGLANEFGLPLPHFEIWLSLSASICLLLGATTLARSEKELLSEHSMQYNAMATMYRAA
ncbi:MAG: hypothetical protein KDA85_22950, partial [Planctomycetaceae bacterium]|nr:hypothetical protein [Planctomycetaceae bacterium]